MSVLRPSAHSTTTSPPRPPSPPSGPPNSMNFSRRNETHPAPPSPERMGTLASARNFMGDVHQLRAFPHPLAVAHDEDEIRKGAHDAQIMADEEIGKVALRLEGAQEIDDLRL